MVLAICINDSDKPNEIPESKWLKKDRVYEVESIGITTNNVVNIHLVEPKLGEESLPYTGFSRDRFRFNSKGDHQKSEELVKGMMEELGL